MHTAIGQNVHRKEAWDKVTGRALYADDLPILGTLSARLLTSVHAHAHILNIDTAKAWATEGVKAVITGKDCSRLFGTLIMDRPALATDKVRYAGEPVAMVVAVDEYTAETAVRRIVVDYEKLPVVLTPTKALNAGAPLLHQNMDGYKKTSADVYPQDGTNIASRCRIQKGDAAAAMEHCDVVAEQRFHLPPSDHFAMEVRTARADISADGIVHILTSSQAPFEVRKQLAEAFNIPVGNIEVRVPFVGGGFGGKAAVMLEILAYLASSKVNGQAVRLTIPREQDMASAPCRIGLEAQVRLGAARDGKLHAAQIVYHLDCGAYADISPYMTKAIAADCTGPYNIENVNCEALCVYTNHTYATSYRSFAHESYTFCMERTLDMLARKCEIDPLVLRRKNAIRPGHLTPTQVVCTKSNTGDLTQCLDKIKALTHWEGGTAVSINPHTVRVWGIACLWKNSNPPTDAISGAMITFNPDGSINLNTGVVEMGSGGQTFLAQILAEKMRMDVSRIHVVMPVDTRLNPVHWKTVASLSAYMAGRAVLRAAEDVIEQLRQNGAQAFSCNPNEIEVAYGRVSMKTNPSAFIDFKDIVSGYKAKDGTSVGEPVLGRGGFMLKGLSMLDPKTGKGKAGPSWTVGAQAVELEVDKRTFTYRILHAYTVMDVGMVMNPDAMSAMVAGGMAMGISLSSREAFVYDENGIPQTPTLRTYKLLHIGQEPCYHVEFVQTPQDDAPYGLRSYSEHGIIAMPAALGNALCAALGAEITQLPLVPEYLWKLSAGGEI